MNNFPNSVKQTDIVALFMLFQLGKEKQSDNKGSSVLFC